MRKHEHDTATLLYGLPNAEALYATPVMCYEHTIEGTHLDSDPVVPTVIEVWSTVPAVAHFPEAERITEWVANHAGEMGEVDEWWYEQVDAAATMPMVIDAAERLVEEMASMVNRRMAHTLVDRLTLTWVDEEPHLDGRPLYSSPADLAEATHALPSAVERPSVAAVHRWLVAHEHGIPVMLAGAAIALLGLVAILGG